MKRVMMLASVASMIDQFNMENIRILRELGYTVDVVTNFEFGSATSQKRIDEFKQELVDDGINVYNIPIPRKITDVRNMIKSYKTVKKLYSTNKYDVMHCHSPIGGVIARLGARASRKKYGTRVIYTAHGFHFFKGAPIMNWLIFYPTEWICSWMTDVLITINKEDFARAKKLHAKSVEYVPGVGIDTEAIRNTHVEKPQKMAEFNIKDEFFLLSVGEINQNKNHEVIIKALSKIDIPYKYVLCGKGDRQPYLECLAEKLRIAEKVIFAGYRTDIRELLKCADIFLLPSFREGLSVALMEAMAAGLPCVVSEIRGNVDLIDTNGGVFFDPHDVSECKTAIEGILQSDLNEFSEYNLHKIKEFSCICVGEKMRKIYGG